MMMNEDLAFQFRILLGCYHPHAKLFLFINLQPGSSNNAHTMDLQNTQLRLSRAM